MFVRILFFLVVFTTMASAQKPIRYTVENGLPSNHVYKVAQDNEGFVWILTDKGMVRFDGTDFKTFTTRDGLPLNDIWDVRFTPDGRVWFFTRASKLGYIENDQVYTFQNSNPSESLYPATIYQNGNSIAFAGGNAYYELSGYPSQDSQKVPKWVKSSPIKWQKLTERLINSLEQKSASYHCGQLRDSLLVGLGDSRYSVLNLNTNQLITHRYDEFDESLRVVKFPRFTIHNGVIQIFGLGFSAILGDDGRLVGLTKALANYGSHGGIVDENDNLWMATTSQGVFFIPSSIRRANYHLVGKKVSRLKLLHGKVVASVYNQGFYEYDGSAGIFFPFIQEEGAIYSVFSEGGVEYYLTDHKYIKLAAGQKETIFRDYQQAAIFKVLKFRDTLFGLGSMLLAVVDTNSFEWKKQAISIGLSDFVVYKNRLLFASSNGLMEYQNGHIVPVEIGGFIFSQPSIHLGTCAGRLVICTDGYGAYLTDLERLDSLPKSAYLSVQSSYTQANNLWLATNSGVLQYHFGLDKPKFVRGYSLNEGLLSKSISDVLVLGDSLFISADYGVSVLPLEEQVQRPPILNIYCKGAYYNQVFFEDNASFDYAKNNQLEVNIGTIDFAITKNNRFEYRLKPIMSEWQKFSSSSLSFSNLAPKDYVLEIRKGDLVRKLHFSIQPLWYQTAFAKFCFALLSLAGIFWGARKYNHYHLRKQEVALSVRRKEIEQELYALRSQMNPHFVFNSLNAIQYYIANNDLYLSEKYLVKFSKLIRMFFDFSRKGTITMKEEMDLLESYMAMEKMRFGEDLEYEFKINDTIDLGVEVIPTMLLQPILENAVNHGVFHHKGVGRIVVDVREGVEGELYISISDNGIGWDNVQQVLKQSLSEHHLNSTKILLEKIELLNQSGFWYIDLQVSDNEACKTGTSVRFVIVNHNRNQKIIDQPKLEKSYT